MKSYIVLSSILVVLIMGALVRGETALLVVGENAYIIEASAGGLLSMKDLGVDKIWIDGDIPDDPDDPPIPGSIAEKAQEISSRLLQSKLEAMALSSIVNRLSQDDVDQSKLRAALDTSIATLSSSSLFTGNKFAEWKDEILQLGELSSALLGQVDIGVRKAFDLSQPAGGSSILWLKTLQGLAATDIMKIDIGTLIQLLELIFRLLKDLGIFDFSSDSLPPHSPHSGVLIPVPAAQ